MKKLISLILVMACLALMLAGCGCEHEWKDANCTDPMTCSLCGETEGEALGHSWTDADCDTPKTCSVCGETDGEAPGHQWTDGNCQTFKTCSVCGESNGELGDHDYVDGSCTVCGATEPVSVLVPTLVTDVSTLKVGDQIIIAAKSENYAMSTTQNTNNRGSAAVTKSGNTLTYGSDVQIITLEAGKVAGTFAFNVGNGYLYAASTSSNYLISICYKYTYI